MKIAARSPLLRLRLLAVSVAMLLLFVFLVAGCGSSSSSSSGASSSASASVGGAGSTSPIAAVAAENEYANVLEQIGGKYVKVTAIESNPNTDPHTYEASASTAQAVSGAKMLIENGVGYDTFMDKIASASPDSSRKVINVQKLLGLPESTPNPHLWYKPSTMPAVAKAWSATSRRSIPLMRRTSRKTPRSSKHRSSRGTRR